VPKAPALHQVEAKPNFEAAAIGALQAVRLAFSRIIEHKCPHSKAVTSVVEAFGVHRKLAWQVIKVAYSDDPFVAASHMPSPKSLGVWLDAAEGAGAPRAVVAAARGAAAKFQSLAAAHTTSRTEMEMLLGSCAPPTDAAAHAKWRQQSFNGNSFVWGAHCKALLALMVLQPSNDREHFFHMAQVRGLLGFRQTRPGVRWTVNQSVVTDDSSRAETEVRRVALNPSAARAHDGVPVFPEFCSNPMPPISRRKGPDGTVYDEFVSGPVGQSGERTLVTGEVIRNLGAAHATPTDKVAHFGTGVRIPAELLQMDMFVHRTLFAGVERELKVFSDLASQVAFDEADALPAPERISRLGRGIALAQSQDIPAYADLAAAVFEALDAEPDDYDLFRVRMAYPPMPVSVMFRHKLPPAPVARTKRK
jgi:hypothetical protein